MMGLPREAELHALFLGRVHRLESGQNKNVFSLRKKIAVKIFADF
jgi:hypothetical protein